MADDIELTKIRHKQITQRGFPIFVVESIDEVNRNKIIMKAFFTQQGLDDYVNTLDGNYIVKMVYADDIRNVSYEI